MAADLSPFSALESLTENTTSSEMDSSSTDPSRAHINNTGHNSSFDFIEGHDQCIRVVFSQMPFIPWDNRDNLISEETETVVYRIKNNLLVLLFLIGGPANVINMAVFYKHGLQDRVNLCLFALSLADEIHLTISTVMHAEQMYIQVTTKERFGPIFTFIANTNLMALLASTYISHVLSAMIALERCLCVMNPLRFQTLIRTRTVAIIIVVIGVLITGMYSVIVFRYTVGCYFDPLTGALTTTFVEGQFYKEHKQLINNMHSFVLGLGFPVVEILVVTTATTITIVKLRQAVTRRSEMTTSPSVSISAKELALTKILVGSSLFFIGCITPVTVIRFSNLFVPELNSGRRYHNLFLAWVWFTEMFSLTNATFNFFVYFSMGSYYRKTFWALFGRRKEKEMATK